MKKFFKLKAIQRIAGIIALAALIGFSMAACDTDGGGGDGGTTTNLLDGVWEISGTRVTVSGGTGVFSALNYANSLGQSAMSKGYISVGTQYWKGITSTGNLTCSGQQLMISYNTLNPTVATGTEWTNCTFTLSADGQTLTVSTSKSTDIWTRPTTYSLNGVWESSGGMQVTVSGSTGVVNAFGSVNALGQSAIDKGYLTLNSTYWRNLTSTGNLTWSGQLMSIQHQTNSNVAEGTDWRNCTFTLSTNGQTLTVTGSDSGGAFTYTYTRVSTYSIDGVWASGSGSNQITVSGNSGVWSKIYASDALTQSAINKSYIYVDCQFWKNITKTGNLTWSGQSLTIQHNTNSNEATGITWTNCTFTMSADGQTLTETGLADTSGTTTRTWTRVSTGGGGGNVVNSTFTLTGIPSEYNGKYAYLIGSDSDFTLFGTQSISNISGSSFSMTCSKISSNGSVSLPMWKINNTDTTFVKYSGNDMISTLTVYITNTASITGSSLPEDIDYVMFYNTPITFSNGGATRSWVQGDGYK